MILTLIKRNLRLYFRDKATVFFSLFGVLIVLALYLFILMKMITPDPSQTPGIDVNIFARNWVMAGVISVTTVTTTLGAFGIYINDIERNIMNDFKVSPIKRSTLVLCYIISALIIGVIMSLFAFVFTEIYILASGGTILSFGAIIKAVLVIILGVTMSSSIMFFIIGFIKTANAFSAVSTVFGSIAGFLMGVYVPIGVLGKGIEEVIKAFPFSHTVALMRQIMITDMLPNGVGLEVLDSDSVLHFMGIQYFYGSQALPFYGHVLIMIGVTILFFGLGVVVFSRKRK